MDCFFCFLCFLERRPPTWAPGTCVEGGGEALEEIPDSSVEETGRPTFILEGVAFILEGDAFILEGGGGGGAFLLGAEVDEPIPISIIGRETTGTSKVDRLKAAPQMKAR